MEITQNFLTQNRYSRVGLKMSAIKGIVIHYVGNAGSTAIANRNYFEGLKIGKKDKNGDLIYASSQYIIGLLGEIVQCMPEDEVAYHAKDANSTYIGIECCHPDTNGRFNGLTYNSLIELCVDICKRYGLTEKNIIRHFDVTGKLCPLFYVKNSEEWQKLKIDVGNKLKEVEEMVTALNIKVDNGDIKAIPSILKDGVNYPQLRELMGLIGYSVGYDANSKVVTLTKK